MMMCFCVVHCPPARGPPTSHQPPRVSLQERAVREALRPHGRPAGATAWGVGAQVRRELGIGTCSRLDDVPVRHLFPPPQLSKVCALHVLGAKMYACVCMCVCMYVCMYPCIHVCIPSRIALYIFTHACMKCMYIHMYTASAGSSRRCWRWPSRAHAPLSQAPPPPLALPAARHWMWDRPRFVSLLLEEP